MLTPKERHEILKAHWSKVSVDSFRALYYADRAYYKKMQELYNLI
jgi:hypothetical protein